jgi:hypothetical protein
LQGPARGDQIAKFAYAEFALSATGRWSPGSFLAIAGRHCDRRVRASASGKAVVPSPVSRRSSLDDGDRAQTTRSLAWRPGSDRRQAVDDLSENPPDACSRPPNQLTRPVTPSPAAIAGRAAAPRSPGARLPKLLRSGSLGLAAALATMRKSCRELSGAVPIGSTSGRTVSIRTHARTRRTVRRTGRRRMSVPGHQWWRSKSVGHDSGNMCR